MDQFEQCRWLERWGERTFTRKTLLHYNAVEPMKGYSLQPQLSGRPFSVSHIFNWLSVQHSLPDKGHIPLTVAISNKAPVRTFSFHLELLKEYLGTVQAGNVSIFAGLACCNIKIEKSAGHIAHFHVSFAEMGINADCEM